MSALSGLFTSESVTEGHPDKVCDQVSDAILDAFLSRDARARVACETFIADQRVIIAGEFRTQDPAVFLAVRDQAESIARDTLRSIGYGDSDLDIDPDRCRVEVLFNRQSPNIQAGTDKSDGTVGAGDQGMMFGYASSESEALMPLPITLAHRLTRGMSTARRSGRLPFLRPDGKAQVTVRYPVHGVPLVETVVVSAQHAPGITLDDLREGIMEEVVIPSIPAAQRAPRFRVLINPAGAFEIGGPKGDTGLTGRKIIVDTYGGAYPHGGGAFSGKDPTKVDRSGAYAARHVAKNLVAAGIAPRCGVQLAYAIGVAEPIAVNVDLFGSPDADAAAVSRVVLDTFDLSPAGIIRELRLDRPIYRRTAAFGHFGREGDGFSWESTAKVPELGDRFQAARIASTATA